MKIRIILADDHAVVREGLHYLLDIQQDLEVIDTVADGRQAIDRCIQLKPDVVVMDIDLPVLNGIEATHQIRDTCPETQVVILSMYATREHIYSAFQAGAQGYLLKESAGREVAEAVRTVHIGQRYLSPRINEMVVDGNLQMQEEWVDKSPLRKLSAREREILQLVVEGKSNTEIAQTFSLSPKTVETYRSRMMEKLGINDVPSLVKFATKYGLTSLV
jgi:DNA-binding NarL/FixJ family response regulator